MRQKRVIFNRQHRCLPRVVANVINSIAVVVTQSFEFDFQFVSYRSVFWLAVQVLHFARIAFRIIQLPLVDLVEVNQLVSRSERLKEDALFR